MPTRAVAIMAALAAAASLSMGRLAAAAAPEGYDRKATWLDTMIHAQALAAGAQERPAGPLPDLGRSPSTVTAWFRTRQGGTIVAQCPAEGPWAPQGKALFIRRGKVVFDIGFVGAVTAPADVADGQWHHVALAAGPGRQQIYLDGRPVAAGTLAGGANGPDWPLKVGSAAGNFGGDFRGEIDEVRLYARALDANEVRACFQEPAAVEAAGLVARWCFDGDARDASGLHHHGTLAGKISFVEGKLGKALVLNGGRAVVAAGAPDRLAPVWAQMEQDFPDPASRQEMAWEREDGIWGPAWRSGNWAELARRYAQAAHRLPQAAEELAAQAAGATDRQAMLAVREGYLRSRRRAEALGALARHDLVGLRAMIQSLCRTEGDRYAAAGGHLQRLTELEDTGLAALADGSALADWEAQLSRLRRDALVRDHPLLDFARVVFVKRRTFQSNHYYTDYINGCRDFGGNLCILDLRTGQVTDLAPSLKHGIFGRFDVSFDARRIVFGWKASPDEGFRIYEVGVDGAGLRQLTFPPPDEQELIRRYRVRYHHGTDDMHPCYLPDGGICFISTRCQFGILCDAPDDFTTTVLYRMDGDGGNLEKLTNSSVSEASPVVMADGRILYTRWEYVDKGAVSVKCLWAMRPDGTCSVEIYGNDLDLPPTLIHGRDIPDRPNQYVVLGTPHYPQNRVGTVIRLDMDRDIRTRDPMTYLTPYVDIRAEGGFHHSDDGGRTWRRTGGGPLFAEPFPLSDQWFLVSHNPDKDFKDPTAYGLCLLHESGRVVPLHREADTSCWQATPLRPRPVPPVLHSPRDADLAAKGLAAAAVTDVYHGLSGVPRGTVRYLRILEQVPRPWAAQRRWAGDAYDQQHAVVTKDTHLGLKVQHGVVPVEADGSAHFVVPADRNIFLQALDEHFMSVQTERTYVNYRPGEVRTCLGCHETPEQATPPASARNVLALHRAPSVPGPQPGEAAGPRPLHYPTDVQPVLDKHCVRCHSGAEPKGKLDLAGTMTDLFCTSYENLLPERRGGRGRRGYDLVGPTIGENHPKTGNVHYLPPKSLGSHASILVAAHSKGKVLLADPQQAAIADRLAKVHEQVSLPLEDMVRLTNWVDTNGQYYGSYYGRRHLRYKDHPDFRPVPTWESAIGIPPPQQDER